MRPHRLFAAVLAVAAFAARAQNAAAPVTLKVGDPAPPLAVGKWVKGTPVKEFEKGKIYVIECWATWCGPCKVMMPHVTKLQAQYADKGVTVIGVNVWEQDESKVEPFVKEMGEKKMGYAVVLDADPVAPAAGKGLPAGKMATTWLKAAGRNGIPCSFVIDKAGKIAWIGHPMQMDLPVRLLVADTFDTAAVEQAEKKSDELRAAFQKAMVEKRYDDADKALDELLAASPAMGAFLGSAKLQIAIQKGDYPRAHAMARTAIDAPGTRDDAQALGGTLSTLIAAPDPAKLDPKLVEELAAKVYDLEGKKGWQVEWLVGRAYAAIGQLPKAVEFQTKALADSPDQLKPMMQKKLDEYTAKQK